DDAWAGLIGSYADGPAASLACWTALRTARASETPSRAASRRPAARWRAVRRIVRVLGAEDMAGRGREDGRRYAARSGEFECSRRRLLGGGGARPALTPGRRPRWPRQEPSAPFGRASPARPRRRPPSTLSLLPTMANDASAQGENAQSSSQSDARRAADAARAKASEALHEIRLAGNQLVDKVRDLIEEGNVRRIVIKKEDRVLFELPLTVGVGAGAAAVLISPVLAALGAIAALVTDITLLVEREEDEGGGPSGGAKKSAAKS